MIINIMCLIIGFATGAVCAYYYDYYRNIKEFNKRQEMYKKRI